MVCAKFVERAAWAKAHDELNAIRRAYRWCAVGLGEADECLARIERARSATADLRHAVPPLETWRTNLGVGGAGGSETRPYWGFGGHVGVEAG